MPRRRPLAGLFAGLAAASIWGGMYVVSKVVLEVIPPFTLLALRLLLGAATLGVVVYFQKDKTAFPPSIFRKSLLVGFVGYGVSLGFQLVGTKLSTASIGSLVTSATPAFVLLFAPLLLGERAALRGVIALIVSVAGVVAVVNPRGADLSPAMFWGNLCLLAAALTWALYSVLARKISASADLLASGAVMLLGGLPSTLLFSLWELNAQGVGKITPGVVGGLLFLGIISTAVAASLWNYAFAELPAAAASLTIFAQPVVGTLLGWFFLSEKIAPLFIAGGFLIGIGILIAAFEK